MSYNITIQMTTIDQQIADAKTKLDLLVTLKQTYDQSNIADSYQYLEHVSWVDKISDVGNTLQVAVISVTNILKDINQRLVNMENKNNLVSSDNKESKDVINDDTDSVESYDYEDEPNYDTISFGSSEDEPNVDDDAISVELTDDDMTEDELEEEYYKEMLDKRLLESKIFKSKQLRLSNIDMTILPAELKTFTWVTNLRIDNCNLDCLANLPPNIQYLDAGFNNLTEIISDYIPKTLIRASFTDNKIKRIEKLHEGLIEINLCNNFLDETCFEYPESLEFAFPESIQFVFLDNNMFNRVPTFGKNIIILSMNYNNLTNIDNLPDNLEELYAYANNIKYIRKLPKNLLVLEASNNKIDYMLMTPPKLETLNVSLNNLTSTPPLSENIKYADISYNFIFKNTIKSLPETLVLIDMRGNTETFLDDVFSESYFDHRTMLD